MIESKSTIDLNLNLMLPLVELINTIMCSSNSIDSSILNLLNTNSHVCDFEIPVKGFRSPSVVDLYVATCLIVNLVLVYACRVRRLQKSHRSHMSNSQDFQELLISIGRTYLNFDWSNFTVAYFFLQL